MATTLSYAGIDLQIIQTLAFDKRPIYDRLNIYLYTEVLISVSAVFNPQATAYSNTDITPSAAQVTKDFQI